MISTNVSKEKLLELMHKYPMPKPAGYENTNWAENNATFNLQAEYALNKYQEDEEARLEPQRKEQQRLEMERVQRLQSAEQERRRQYNSTLSQRQLEAFVSGTHFDSCNNPKCRTASRWHLICPNRNCEAPTKYNMESLIGKLREIAREYLKDKDKKEKSKK
jgi:hypothetical protein